MKTFALALFFSVSTAFAANVCEFRDSQTFSDKVEAGEAIEVARTVGENFTSVQRAIIFETMKTYGQSWRSYKNEYEAVNDFMDYDRYNDRQQEPGSNAGDIVTYTIEGKTFLLVHFYPGDNEFGSVFELQKNGKFKQVAKVSDGEIDCLTK